MGLDLEYAQIHGGLNLSEGSLFKKGVQLGNAIVDGHIELGASIFGGSIFVPDITVGGFLSFGEDAVLQGNLYLSGAHIEEAVYVTNATINGNLYLGYAYLDGGLYVHDHAVVEGRLSVDTARINGDLALLGATINGTIDLSNSVFNGVYLRDGSVFKQGLEMRDTHIIGNLEMFGSKYDGVVDLTGTAVVGSFLLARGKRRLAVWGKGVRLILRNMTVDGFQDSAAAWRVLEGGFVSRDMGGFDYKRIGGYTARYADMDTLADRSVGWLKAWLARGSEYSGRCDSAAERGQIRAWLCTRMAKAWLPPDADVNGKAGVIERAAYAILDTLRDTPQSRAHFEPSAYLQLSKRLDEAGEPRKADGIRYALQDERLRTSQHWVERTRLWLFRVASGYGYHPAWTAGWLLLLSGLTAFLLGRGPRGRAYWAIQEGGVQVRSFVEWSYWRRFLYAVDLSIPFFSFDRTRHVQRPSGKVLYVWALLHQAVALALIVLLFGALTGTIRAT